MPQADAWLSRLTALLTNEQPGGVYTPPADVVNGAYRIGLPCLCRHSTPRNRMANCTAAPRCFAGFLELAPDTAAIKDCVADIMGEGPPLLPAEEKGEEEENEESVVNDTTRPMISVRVPLPHRGIRNLGNTCYLNAILQLLYKSASLRHDVFSACVDASSHEEEEHRTYEVLDDATQNTEEGGGGEVEEVNAINEAQHIKQGLCASGLGELFAEMALTRNGMGANAQPFATFLSLDTQIQQDAQEFFALLVSWLQYEGSRAAEQIFAGTVLYDRRCGNCQRAFKRAEPFFFLSLPVKNTLEEALDTFLQPELVEGFTCDGCNVTATASSSQYIRTLPNVFVVHLNRFTFDLQTLQRDKLTKSVSFPLEWDLTDYINQWRQQQQKGDDRVSGSTNLSANNNNNNNNNNATTTESGSRSQYTLVGIVNHIGETALSGHYTFHGKVNEKMGWYCFDDAEVTKLHHRFQGARASSKEAYMLVYQHRPCEQAANDVVVATHPVQMKNEMTSSSLVLLPPRLLSHMHRLNSELEMKRQRWEMREANVMSFLEQWGDIARNLFVSSSSNDNNNTGAGEGGGEDVMEEKGQRDGVVSRNSGCEDCFAVPESWLHLLGRGFLPSHVDVKQYNDPEKRRRRFRNRTGNKIVSNNPMPVGEGRGSAQGTAACTEVLGNKISEKGNKAEEDEEDMLFEGISRAALLNHMKSLRCPHGKLAPWAPYKVVSSSMSAALASLVNNMSTLTTTGFHRAEETPITFLGLNVSENACGICTRVMADEILQLKRSWDEEKTALSMLSETCDAVKAACGGGSKNKNNNNDNNTICHNEEEACEEEMQRKEERDEEEEAKVYVNRGVIEFWKESLLENATSKTVVGLQGFTGLYAATHKQKASYYAAAASPASAAVCCDDDDDDVAFTHSRPNFGRLLCEHRLLSPLAAVSVVPAGLWRYLREHVVLPLCAGDTTCCEWLEQTLPFLPVENTSVCQTCIDTAVSTTAQRHGAKLAKMYETKRFPTLVAAGQIIFASQAEMREQHPNRGVFKGKLDRRCREHQRSWEKEQAAVIAGMEADVAALKVKEEEERLAEAAWRAKQVRRGGHKKRGKQSNSNNSDNTAAQNTLQTTTTTQAAVATVITAPLQQAEEALAAARTATCPDLCERYGCVPMWWVSYWRRWHMNTDDSVSPPPRFDHEAFRCQHGKTLIAPHLLNPADPFWERKSFADHFMQLWRQRIAPPAVTRDDVAQVISCNDDSESLLMFPPFLLVPFPEFIEILETYGQLNMLLSSTATPTQKPAPPSEDDGEESKKNVERQVNPSKTILFLERNTERVFDPPSCELCGAALLEKIKESSYCFLNGSVKLQLHLRRSKKNFYDATDVLRNVHHTTTLRELRHEISRLVAENHGFLLPLEEMELLRGRKPLRAGQFRTAQRGESTPPPPPQSCASPPVVPNPAASTSMRLDENDCTLFDFGLCDGDVLTVNATERVLAKIADAGEEADVWEEVPSELLQPVQENKVAFGATRLCGAMGKARQSSAADVTATTAAAEVACDVCTFLNAPGRVCCEMCETPLKR